MSISLIEVHLINALFDVPHGLCSGEGHTPSHQHITHYDLFL